MLTLISYHQATPSSRIMFNTDHEYYWGGGGGGEGEGLIIGRRSLSIL